MGLKYIKYNSDNYQRLGLMKILVAAIDPQRRSSSPDAITRKIVQLLHLNDEGKKALSLIREAGSSSWNFPFTASSVGKILEWGKLLGLLGSGNQITERGLLLRYFMGDGAVQSIKSGDFSVNPFSLTIGEKLFFLYRHFELDDPLYFLIKRLAAEQANTPISGINADRITCMALYDTLKLHAGVQNSSNLLKTRGLRDLISKMATELRVENVIPVRSLVGPRPNPRLRLKSGQKDKKRTKTADHEAIPRFEMLTDLGLLEKKVPDHLRNDIERARKSWSFWITPLLSEYAGLLPGKFDESFCWSGFSKASVVFSGKLPTTPLAKDSPALVLRVYDAYQTVKRPFGHTPLESIALMAMIRASAGQENVEMNVIHALFMEFKSNRNLQATVHFAAGNDLNRMFVDLRPNFIEQVKSSYQKAAYLDIPKE